MSFVTFTTDSPVAVVATTDHLSGKTTCGVGKFIPNFFQLSHGQKTVPYGCHESSWLFKNKDPGLILEIMPI